MNFPQDLKYTEEHEWIKSIDEQTALVGITDFAQGELGDIVYIDIPTIGKTLNAGDVFGTIEAVKTVSDLFLPVSGTVLEVNPNLEKQPELVNQSPYEAGWLIKLSVKDASEINKLLSAEEYSKKVQ
jgi:glycine cleavage system H protein